MKKQEISETFRAIGWNGIDFLVPRGWEVIVSGDRHLLVEYDFQPVLEIRWEHDTRQRSTAELFSVIRRSLQKGSACTEVTPLELKEEYAELALNRQAISFTLEKNQHQVIAWRCPVSGFVISCHLFSHPRVPPTTLADVLMSVQGHSNERASLTWSIQDMRFTSPESFAFNGYNFQAGLTRVSFHSRQARIHFCRLAPATERLKSHILSEILAVLLGTEIHDQEALIENDTTFEWCRSPGLTRQILARLRRQKPFRWGRIWYDAMTNRLLAVSAESTRPIDLKTLHALCSKYEIVTFPKKQSCNPEPH